MPDPTLKATIRFVVNQHYDQVDKAGLPYVLHLMRVASNFQTEEEITVALLHDVVEDTDVTLDYLKLMRYPTTVIEAVDCLTKRPEEEGDYDTYLQRVLSGPELVRRIKLADLRDNADLTRLATPSDADLARCAKYRAAIQLVESSLAPTIAEESP
jgi:(p)ppGpp synthase/HD superfamily hydrolase